LLLDGIGRIFDETVGRNDEEKTIDRAVGTILFEEVKEFLPLAGFARLDLLEHQPAGSIEQNSVVREPPVHIDRAANALKFVLHSWGKANIAVANGLGFARARFANDDIPRKLVEIFAAGVVRLDT